MGNAAALGLPPGPGGQYPAIASASAALGRLLRALKLRDRNLDADMFHSFSVLLLSEALFSVFVADVVTSVWVVSGQFLPTTIGVDI